MIQYEKPDNSGYLSVYQWLSMIMDASMDTLQDRSPLALQVKDVHKFYGRGPGAYHVLRSLNMEVQYGSM